MPYYVGIINDRVESLNDTLPPEEALQRYIQFEQIDKPMVNPCYVDNVFRERTAEEIEAINQAKARLDALNRNIFTKLEIRDAFKDIYGTAESLNALINSNQEFKDYWADTTIIDLKHPLTIQAMEEIEINIDQIKLKIAGV